MKLKEQINMQRAYAISKRNKARQDKDPIQESYWMGVCQSMEWVQESRDDWHYINAERMVKDQGRAF